jgi:subtilisin
MKKGALVLAALAIACGGSDSSVTTETAAQRSLDGSAAENRYIVVFAPGVGDPAQAAAALLRAHGGTLGFVYRYALSGFSAELPPAAVEAIARSPVVSFVERDQIMEAFAQTVPMGIKRIFAEANTKLGIDGIDDLRVDVDVAVIDTGIDFDHPDLNVVARTDCSGGSPFKASCSDGTGDDGNGHGTHVAGTVAAIDNDFGVVGVAPGARLWAVKVLGDNGNGWNSGVIAGVDWVTKNAGSIEVANMSLGGGDSPALCQAVNDSVGKGVVYAVAAGNSDAEAANYSPANCEKAIAVSALADFNGLPGGKAASTCRSDQDDTLADFSNWSTTKENGEPKVELLAAPGVCILSTWAGGGYSTISGTSMASPHVAGAAALLKAKPGGATPSDVRTALRSNGNFAWTDDSGDGIHEPLLDVSNTQVFAPAMVGGSPLAPAPDEEEEVVPVTGISLTASPYKVKGVQHASLNWSYSPPESKTSTTVDVWRDDAKTPETGTANDGAHEDVIGKKGGGSYRYKICERDMSACSNEVTVTF